MLNIFVQIGVNALKIHILWTLLPVSQNKTLIKYENITICLLILGLKRVVKIKKIKSPKLVGLK